MNLDDALARVAARGASTSRRWAKVALDFNGRCTRLANQLRWRHHNLRYRGHADDLFIAAFPESGLELMRMLVYQMSTDGRLDAQHGPGFSPLVEDIVLAQPAARTLDDLPQPHLFASHLPYRLIPHGPGRYICVLRRGLDVAVASYTTVVRYWFRGSFPEYYELFHRGRVPMPNKAETGTWFDHTAEWLANARGLNVLYVNYENLTSDLETVGRRVAAFCDIRVPESEWPRIRDRCSPESLRAHERQVTSARFGDPQNMHFIRRGMIGEGRQCSTPAIRDRFDVTCAQVFHDVTPPADVTASTLSSASA